MTPSSSHVISRTVVARVLSIVGHPALLMPVAVAWAARANDAPTSLAMAAVGAAVFLAVCVGVYSALQVKAGRWSHVDASVAHERRELNLFLSLLLLGAAGLLWWLGAPRAALAGLAAGGLIVVFAHLLRARFKLSLHTAFAMFAACLLWPSGWATAACTGLALGVAWSRLVLGRHTLGEVVLGAVAGGMAGVGFQVFAL